MNEASKSIIHQSQISASQCGILKRLKQEIAKKKLTQIEKNYNVPYMSHFDGSMDFPPTEFYGGAGLPYKYNDYHLFADTKRVLA